MKRFVFLTLSLLLIASLMLPGCSGGQSAKIRVATDATWPPFESVDEKTKEIVGFDIDLFKAIAAKQGLQVEFINVNFDPLLAGMAKGQYDAAISSITITEDRKKDMLFSDPYFSAGQIIVVKKTNTTITDKTNLAGKVGAQIGTTGAMEVGKIAAATLKTYDEIGLAYQDLMNGQIDAVVADNPIALDYVLKNADKLKTVGSVFTDESYGIAVSKNNPELLTKINAGLKAVKADNLPDQLVQKWLGASN